MDTHALCGDISPNGYISDSPEKLNTTNMLFQEFGLLDLPTGTSNLSSVCLRGSNPSTARSRTFVSLADSYDGFLYSRNNIVR